MTHAATLHPHSRTSIEEIREIEDAEASCAAVTNGIAENRSAAVIAERRSSRKCEVRNGTAPVAGSYAWLRNDQSVRTGVGIVNHTAESCYNNTVHCRPDVAVRVLLFPGEPMDSLAAIQAGLVYKVTLAEG